MLLSEILTDICSIPSGADRDISRLHLDSRCIQSGDLFIAIKGSHFDGNAFIANAIARGASAVLTDSDQSISQHIPIIYLPNLKKLLGLLAAKFYDFPAKQLKMIGITGTNGKTSCSHFIAQLLQSFGESCGIIGTLGSGFYGKLGDPGLTTPDAIALQAMLTEFRDQGAKAIAMEVSSHSIDQERVGQIEFAIGVFTNLTQDHLDYHGDMQTYAAVKHRFLASDLTRQVVLNADDSYGKKWIADLASIKKVYAYTTDAAAIFPSHLQVIRAKNIELSLHGIKARVITPWGSDDLISSLIGKFNLNNMLAVISVLGIYGIPLADILSHLKKLHPVPGRMQTLGGQGKPLIVVDYAHTPDALEKVLQALRGHTKGKLICVFGCGGDRDKTKRPLMAKIAEQWSDKVIVTSDNPRHENPASIAEEIMQGFMHPEHVLLELDRTKAIKNSIQSAHEHDCILIAGKGAERYQQIGDEKFPFDDVEKVRENLNVIIAK